MKTLAKHLSVLADEMDSQAASIWTWISLVRGHPNFPGRLGETTITEYLQAQLWDYWSGQVQYNVPDEPTTGADWEWYVGSSKLNEWICIRVQAKILSSQLKFSSIGHRVGTGVQAARQMDILVRSSQTNTCFTAPYYAFYISDVPNTNSTGSTNWTLHAWASPQPTTKREFFGCTVVRADHVVLSYENSWGARNNPDTYLPNGVPWANLFRALETWVRTGSSRPNANAQQIALLRLVRILNGGLQPTTEDLATARADSFLAHWFENLRPAQAVDGVLPEYARGDLLESKKTADLFRSSKTRELLSASDRPPADAPITLDVISKVDVEAKSDSQNRSTLRKERPDGAPRLGISFFDIDDLPLRDI